MHSNFSVTLQLKTTESDGLILYNGGKKEKGNRQDYFALEMEEGFLYYDYDMGNGPQRVKANTQHPINDNKWHEVRNLIRYSDK